MRLLWGLLVRFGVCMACVAGAVVTGPLAYLALLSAVPDLKYMPEALGRLALLTVCFCAACLTVYSTLHWLKDRNRDERR
jgi:hypothetical protein